MHTFLQRRPLLEGLRESELDIFWSDNGQSRRPPPFSKSIALVLMTRSPSQSSSPSFQASLSPMMPLLMLSVSKALEDSRKDS